ncbi:MAG: hypothetical protein NZ585_03270 [Chloracidobacterium sp.]|nr:hypothetical protein [Chloracidobacterium sp.]MDW8217233.1 hypothetical protein [Acidobacteriota bacterium]
MSTEERVWAILEQTSKEISLLSSEIRELRHAQQETDRLLREFIQQNDRRMEETDRLLREVIQENARRMEETDRRFKETEQLIEKNARQIQENSLLAKESKRELKEIKQLIKETDRQLKETDQRLKETDRQIKETDRQIKKLGKQFGDAGNSFGRYNEELPYPSLKRLLQKQLGFDYIVQRLAIQKGVDYLELDAAAFSTERPDTACIVEIKTRFDSKAVKRLLDVIRRAASFDLMFAGKEVYGMAAAVDFPAQVRQQCLSTGLYVAIIADNLAMLDTPPDFKPRPYLSRSDDETAATPKKSRRNAA